MDKRKYLPSYVCLGVDYEYDEYGQLTCHIQSIPTASLFGLSPNQPLTKEMAIEGLRIMNTFFDDNDDED